MSCGLWKWKDQRSLRLLLSIWLVGETHRYLSSRTHYPSLPIPPLTCLASEAPPHPRLALLPVLLSLAQDHSRLLQCQVRSSADLWGKGKRTAVTPRSPPPPPPHDIRESWPSTGWEIPFSIWRKEMGAPLLDPPVYVILGGSWPSQKPFPLWT